MVTINNYELLGVPRSASPDEIRVAYRRMLKHVHPDTGGSDGMFTLVNDAFNVLKDPSSRAAYDRILDGKSVPSAAGASSQPKTGSTGSTGSSTGSSQGSASQPNSGSSGSEYRQRAQRERAKSAADTAREKERLAWDALGPDYQIARSYKEAAHWKLVDGYFALAMFIIATIVAVITAITDYLEYWNGGFSKYGLFGVIITLIVTALWTVGMAWLSAMAVSLIGSIYIKIRTVRAKLARRSEHKKAGH